MVKSPLENGKGTTAVDGVTRDGMRTGEPAMVAGPGFGLAGLV
jgi:hypothetical protein